MPLQNWQCDFCYKGYHTWNAEMMHDSNLMGWTFRICNSCRLLLANVIGPVMHKLTHVQVVEALQAKMDELGITYEDLMDTSGLEEVPAIEGGNKMIEGVVDHG